MCSAAETSTESAQLAGGAPPVGSTCTFGMVFGSLLAIAGTPGCSSMASPGCCKHLTQSTESDAETRIFGTQIDFFICAYHSKLVS